MNRARAYVDSICGHRLDDDGCDGCDLGMAAYLAGWKARGEADVEAASPYGGTGVPRAIRALDEEEDTDEPT